MLQFRQVSCVALATFDLTEEAFAAMFADGAAPSVRIILDIPE